ncbi:MBL fold metallo-hydrolase [Microbacterium sp. H1-D42]|uniref:MBL fold metallo-hydrolase n=1 Tax=Microbacterium sp. H1-D42 TaxID=2925844 RepID=UPI001F5327FA|nr:MBL fold metallo-hydrolase [Microbacterium sp. H1-D42]UNK71504.1 MBL fold metallo-hydrolase [Microbacterium sp. H1-D42]
MIPLSEAQHRAATSGEMPQPESIRDGLWSVPMPMPGARLAYNLAAVCIAPSGAVSVVDPGWEAPGSADLLDAFLQTRGARIEDVQNIIVTHAHPDHIGSAESLRQRSGAQVVMHRREQQSIDVGATGTLGLSERMREWGVAESMTSVLVERMHAAELAGGALAHADLLVDDGDLLPVEGLEWRVLHTPGHTPGHICLVDAEHELILTGDHVLPMVFPGVGLGADLGTNAPDDYLRSLRRLAPFDDFEVVPGHGYRFRGLRERRSDAAAHALQRAQEVEKVLREDPGASTWDVASRLTWKGGWARVSSGWMLYSGLVQTSMYREFVASDGIARHTHA